jgi:hypothetical protein
MIIVESKRKKPATILKKYPDAILADVTSGAKDGLVKLSPFYPHGGIRKNFRRFSMLRRRTAILLRLQCT